VQSIGCTKSVQFFKLFEDHLEINKAMSCQGENYQEMMSCSLEIAFTLSLLHLTIIDTSRQSLCVSMWVYVRRGTNYSELWSYSEKIHHTSLYIDWHMDNGYVSLLKKARDEGRTAHTT
jgi:hypothetical protein